MRQGKRGHLARRKRREPCLDGRWSSPARATAELRKHRNDPGWLRGIQRLDRDGGDASGITLDFRPRTVSALELEEWRDYATSIGLGETRWNSDRTFGYEVVVIPDHDQGEDDLLAKLYTRARLRLRKTRLKEDGASLWFELCGPDGWVRIGRKVQLAIDAVGEPT